MSTLTSEIGTTGDKIKRYGWTTKDQPGELMGLHKDVLQIHPAYQRDANIKKSREIASSWSWVAAGVIVVGERGGEYWVIDGQHRLLAAKRRSDIKTLPCIVFQTEDVKEEAVGFLNLNTGRKPVNSMGKFKAMIAAGDEVACAVHAELESLGITAKPTATKPGEIKSVSWAIKRAGEDVAKFKLVLRVAADISRDGPILERLLDGLWYINENVDGGIESKRMLDRITSIGGRRLVDAANKAAAYFVSGGAKVWATGMLDEINKGLRNKFSMNRADQP